MAAIPVVLRFGESVPAHCPAKLGRSRSQQVEQALRWLPESEARRLVQDLQMSSLTVLLPTSGSHVERLAKTLAQERLISKSRPKANAAAAKDESGLQDEDENEGEKPQLQNPAGVWVEDPKRPGSEEKAITELAFMAEGYCKVETQGMMPGDSITFTVLVKGREGKPDEKIGAMAGRVAEGRQDQAAVGRFLLEPEVKGRRLIEKKDQIFFIAKSFAHQLEAISKPIDIQKVKPPFAFSL
jgi:hypothetical protein